MLSFVLRRALSSKTPQLGITNSAKGLVRSSSGKSMRSCFTQQQTPRDTHSSSPMCGRLSQGDFHTQSTFGSGARPLWFWLYFMDGEIPLSGDAGHNIALHQTSYVGGWAWSLNAYPSKIVTDTIIVTIRGVRGHDRACHGLLESLHPATRIM